MGEFFELFEAGILDASGEYTGYENGTGFPVCPKGWFKEKTNNYGKNKINYRKVTSLIKQICGNNISVSKAIRYYGKTIGDYAVNENFAICNKICSGGNKAEWNKFKRWLNKNYKQN